VTTGLTITDVRRNGEACAVRCEDGRIVALGPEAAAAPGDDVVDGRGLALVAGLVNGHTHAAMTLLRGSGDDLPLMQWLQQLVWPAEARLTGDDVYWGTRLACIEMIRSGTVRFWDMYWHSADTARAVVDSGLRAAVSQVVLDGDDVPPEAGIDRADDGVAALAEHGSRVTPSLGPHAIYTVSTASLRRIAEISAARDVPVQIHLSETEHEVVECLDAHGMRPAHYLDSLGLLDERTLLAHGVWLDEAELDLVATRGATVVTNPVSNMKLAVGRAFPYPAARSAGVPLGLGTDGAASNDSLDLLQDVKVLALLQKHETRDPSTLPAADAWELVTGRDSSLLGGTAVEVGAPADFLLVDTHVPELTAAPLDIGLVYSATGAVVDTVVVDGRVLMRARRIEGEEEVRARASEAARRVRTV
jgi:5-methylthioadenosine/S-adenosylhomocysteine deaminase